MKVGLSHPRVFLRSYSFLSKWEDQRRRKKNPFSKFSRTQESLPSRSLRRKEERAPRNCCGVTDGKKQNIISSFALYAARARVRGNRTISESV